MPSLPRKLQLILTGFLIILLAFLVGFSRDQQQGVQGVQAQSPNTWYVSKKGNNADGRSWATAWNELDQINWSQVQSGHTILIDGGATECAFPTTVTGSSGTPRSAGGGTCGMIYQSTLTIGRSGVTIRLASEAGRNGTAVIFGGRSTPLGYCGQSGYNWQTSGVRTKGVDFQGQSGVTLDGTKWSGIIVYGHNLVGIAMEGSRNGVVRNVEVYDNGKWIGDSPDQPGIWPSGTNNVFERVLVHDNGQDAFQSGGNTNNLTLRQSWLYNARRAPDGSFWNGCRHSDGIQIYAGGEQSGVTIEDSVIGPGFLQGVLLGDSKAVIHDVTVRNSLWYGSGNANIMVDDRYPVNARNLRIENVTSDRTTGETWHNTFFQGAPSQVTITNSIFYGGNLMSVPGGGSYSGNCQYQVGGTSVGTTVNPKYANPSVHGSSSTTADFKLASDSPCAGKGSSITSVAQLLGQPVSTPGPTSTPTPTKSLTPTPTKSPTPPLLPGDLDKDGDVDIFDYNLLVENFGNTHCGNVADIDSDCDVDIFDYNILIENFGK